MTLDHQKIVDKLNKQTVTHPLASRMMWVCVCAYLIMGAMAGGFVAGYIIGFRGVS